MSIAVLDPFGAATDSEMPSLALAVDPCVMERKLRRLPRLSGEHGFVQLRAIRVTRHKPGRRCLIEYDVDVAQPGAAPEPITLIGKVRAGRPGRSDYRLLNALWNAGFAADSPDGISVPEPIGPVPKLRMWLQRKVSGRVGTALLDGPRGTALARQIAEAAHKVHRARVPAERRHTMDEELRVLHDSLPRVGRIEPRWTPRVERLLDACDRLGATTPQPVLCGIHRDFYPDQVIVDGRRIYLIDFDLYCEGDAGLDIGNFLGHVTEQSLRTLGDPGALAEVERAMEERFVELSGEATRAAVRNYATLTLARHVFLSTLFPERRRLTGSLLELCEERLGLPLSVPR